MARILIIDDDPSVIGFLTNVLTDNDHEVVSAENGRDGMARAKETSPDLILLDIEMGRESGPDFYRRLRRVKELASTPVIVVSGYHSKHVAVTRSVPVLEKPVEEEALLEQVRQSLANAGS